MSRDRSLDEFATGGESDGTDSNGVGEDGPDDDEPIEAASEPGNDPDVEETEGGEVPVVEDPTAPGGQSPDADAPAVSIDGVEPLASTYRWSPDGGVCDACGASVETRWREDGALVCEDCKDW